MIKKWEECCLINYLPLQVSQMGLFSSSWPPCRLSIRILPVQLIIICDKIGGRKIYNVDKRKIYNLLRRLVSTAFVLCSQRPASSSSSDGSREEPLVVVAPFTSLSLPFGLLPETGVPQMEDWESIVAEMADWTGARFWEWKTLPSVIPPQLENPVTASCKRN